MLSILNDAIVVVVIVVIIVVVIPRISQSQVGRLRIMEELAVVVLMLPCQEITDLLIQSKMSNDIMISCSLATITMS